MRSNHRLVHDRSAAWISCLIAGMMILVSCSPAPAAAPALAPSLTPPPTATSIPATDTPAPTPTPLDPIAAQWADVPVVEWQAEENTEKLPVNVMSEFTYYGGAGGTGEDWCPPTNIPGQPKIIQVTEEIVLFQTAMINTCGWKRGEKIHDTLTGPDGKVTQRDFVIEDETLVVEEWFRTGYDTLVGDYTYTIQGESATITQTFSVGFPVEPGWASLSDRNQIMIFGFDPGESVQVIVYSYGKGAEDTLVGRSGVKTGSQGSAILTIPKDLNFTRLSLFGEKSGKAYGTTCPKAPVSRLVPGDSGRVTITNGLSVNVRDKPDGAKTGKLAEGTAFTVVKGPHCILNAVYEKGQKFDQVWYQIKTNNGQTGWVAEGYKNEYFIEPYP